MAAWGASIGQAAFWRVDPATAMSPPGISELVSSIAIGPTARKYAD
jgi:hypothetical protein